MATFTPFVVVFSGSTVCLDTNDDSLEVLNVQLQEFTALAVNGNDGGRLITRKESQTNTHALCSVGDLVKRKSLSCYVNTCL